MEITNYKSILEAILFASGDPLKIDRIAEAMSITEDEVVQVSDILAAEYNEQLRGFKLIRLGDKLQLCTRTEYFDYVRAILEMKRNAPLSQAAFEVLAVIAYNQPVTKSFVEQVRGVDCSGVIGSLCEKGLIEERGRLDLPGRPLIYGTTDDFLRCFSLRSLSDLPPLPEKEEPQETEQEQDTSDNQ
ncbi:MAG: SMC-Scp complex subunit ScpB [Clostridia bacterium]|nr:SMC-Scp complex subunit ScpB [Clostridia bacterium]